MHKEVNKYFTKKDIKSRADYEKIRKAVRDGSLLRLRNGVYVEPSVLADTAIDVEKLVPSGVVCLYSAFSYYNLSTQVPSSTCIAIDSKRKVTLPAYPIIDLYYWKAEYLSFGTVKVDVNGYSFWMTDKERTVCDAIRYRTKIGLDVCGEVLNNYLKLEDRNISKLFSYARQLRIATTITKYLETRL